VHYEILSPLHAPSAYFAYVLNNGSIVIGVYIALRFFQVTRRALWLALVAAFLITSVSSTIFALRHGIPLLPWAEVDPPKELRDTGAVMSHTSVVYTRTYIKWDYTEYLLAIALVSAYFATVGKRAAEPSFRAQT